MGEKQFNNTDETGKSLQRYFKSIHATPKEDFSPKININNESQEV